MTPTSVYVVEDDPLVAASVIKMLKSQHYQVAGRASNYERAIAGINHCRPDIVLLDINLEDEKSGIDIGTYLKEKLNIPFIYTTAYADDLTISEAKATNPVGYILKPFDASDIRANLEIGVSNHKQRKRLVQQEVDWTKVNARLPCKVSKREMDVASLILQGMNNEQISSSLFISVNTVKSHLIKLYDKLGVQSRTSAVARINSLNREI